MRPAEGYTAAQLCSFLFCHSPGGTGCQRDRLEPRVSEACIHPIDDNDDETPQRERQPNPVYHADGRSQRLHLTLLLRFILYQAYLRGAGFGFKCWMYAQTLLG